MQQKVKVRINRITDQAENIRSYELVPVEGHELPAFTAGAHIDFFLPNGLIRQYSLSNDQSERNRYVVGIQREPESRGGSSYIFDTLKEGDEVEVSHPRNHFELDETAERYQLVGGGIGITPILAMARRLVALGKPFQLHYACRSANRAAFMEDLKSEAIAPHLSLTFDDEQGPLNTKALFGTPQPGTQLYCCGPGGLMHAVEEATANWPSGSVRFEHFAAEEDTGPREGDSEFEVVINSSGEHFTVPADKTILTVLEENGIYVDSACQEGICGTCEVRLLEGQADHRDLLLTDEEKEENKVIMVCCSRAKSKSLTLDL